MILHCLLPVQVPKQLFLSVKSKYVLKCAKLNSSSHCTTTKKDVARVVYTVKLSGQYRGTAKLTSWKVTGDTICERNQQ